MIVSKNLNGKFLTEITISDKPEVKPVLADQPVKNGGFGESMRPNELMLSGYVACMNMTARSLLSKENLPFEEVICSVEMKNDEEGITKFYTKVEILGDIPLEKKDEIAKQTKSCFVSQLLSNKKEFYDL